MEEIVRLPKRASENVRPETFSGETFTATEEMKKIKKIYELNPELEKIGSIEKYDKYLETIFPQSKVRGIQYHGTSNELEGETLDVRHNKRGTKLNKGKPDNVGLYFSPDFDYSKGYAFRLEGPTRDIRVEGKTVGVLLNIKNLARAKDAQWEDLSEEEKNRQYPDADGIYGKHLEFQGEKWKTIDKHYGADEYAVFDNSQIYLLGSKHDLEKFKEFVG